MDSTYAILTTGVVMLLIGAFGVAFFARLSRQNQNQAPDIDPDSDNFLGVMMICGVLTGLNGGGLLAIVNAAFTYDPLIRLAIIVAAIAGLAALIKIFWQALGVHKLIYQPPARKSDSKLGLTQSPEQDQRKAA